MAWWTPRPFTTPIVEIDLRPGGANRFVMRGEDGTEYDNRGVYLEVVPDKRLVFTDAYVEAWKPSEKPFMTADIRFEEEGGKTRLTAFARHWSAEDRKSTRKWVSTKAGGRPGRSWKSICARCGPPRSW